MSSRRSAFVVTVAVAVIFGGLFLLEGAPTPSPKPAAVAAALSAGSAQLVAPADASVATASLVRAQIALDPAVAQTATLVDLIDARVGRSGPASGPDVAAATATLRPLTAASDAAAARAAAIQAAAAAIAAPAADPVTVCNCSAERHEVELARAALQARIRQLHQAAAAIGAVIRTAARTCAASPRSLACAAALRQIRVAVAALSAAARDVGSAARALGQAEGDLIRCVVRSRVNHALGRCRNPSGTR